MAVPLGISLAALRWARAEVEAWPDDLAQLDAIAEFRKIVSAAESPVA